MIFFLYIYKQIRSRARHEYFVSVFMTLSQRGHAAPTQQLLLSCPFFLEYGDDDDS